MSGSAIPASNIVSVVPSVLLADGTGLDLNGLLIVADNRIPLGTVASFSNLIEVMSTFGPIDPISVLAGTYFLADINATKRPKALLIACMNNFAWYPAWLRSAQLTDPDIITQLQATNPASTMTITANGVSYKSAQISLSGLATQAQMASQIGIALARSEVPSGSPRFPTYEYADLKYNAATSNTNTITFPPPTPRTGVSASPAILVGDIMYGPPGSGFAGGSLVTSVATTTNPDGTIKSYTCTLANKNIPAGTLQPASIARNPCTYDARSLQFMIATRPPSVAVPPATDPTYDPQTLSNITNYTYNVATVGKFLSSLGSTLQKESMSLSGTNKRMGYSEFMSNILKITQNWASFTTSFNPDTAPTGAVSNPYPKNKLELAAWVNGASNVNIRNNYIYMAWDIDATATTNPKAQTTLGRILNTSLTSGTAPIYSITPSKGAGLAMFAMGTIAATDFDHLNGRKTLAFRGQTGIIPDVTSGIAANNLEANFYNYYGVWTTANDLFRFMYPGLVSGPYKWVDSYVNQIWMNNGFQLALMSLLTQTGSIPYNQTGYTMIKAACQDVINKALNFGAIRTGVSLSELQVIEANNAAGVRIDGVLNSVGYYLQVLDPGADVRALRGTPPCNFWYMDGGSIQRINLASVMIQ